MLLLIAISYLWRRQAGRRVVMAALVLLATLCVLSIFFFPAHQGPYAVTHGPVTELRGLIASASVFLALVFMTLGWFRPSWSIRLLEKSNLSEAARPPQASPSLSEVFRC